MIREEILNMEAGEAIDNLVAEKVMGWHIVEDGFGKNWNDSENHYQCRASNYQSFEDEEDFNLIFWHPSGSLLWAWRVVEKLNMAIVPVENPTGWVCDCDQRTDIEWHWYEREIYQWAYAETAPLAICRAALLAVMDEN